MSVKALFIAWFSGILVCQSIPARATDDTGHPLGSAQLDSLLLHQQYDAALRLASHHLRHTYTRYGLESKATVDALNGMCETFKDLADVLWLELSPHLVDLTSRVYGPNHPRTAEAMAQYALILYRRKSRQAAAPVFEQALQIIEPHKEEAWEIHATILQLYANFKQWSDRSEATRLKAEALSIREAHQMTLQRDLAINKLWLGFGRFQDGDQEKGLEILEEAEQDLVSLGLTHVWQMGTIQGIRGEYDVLQGRLEEAEVAFLRCAEYHERISQRYPPGMGALPKQGYNELPHVQVMLGKKVEAWQSVQKYREAATVQYLDLRGAKRTAPAVYKEMQHLGHRFLQARARRLGCDPETNRKVFWEAMLEEIEAKVAVELKRSEVLNDNTRSVLSLEALQKKLDPKTAYISWVFSNYGNYHRRSKGPILETIWAYVIRREGPIEWVLIEEKTDPAKEDPSGTLHRMLSVDEDWGMPLQEDPRLKVAAMDAGNYLFGPLIPFLKGVEELVVEYPTDIFHFPFEALGMPDGSTLLDHYAVSYVSCARAYLMLDDSPTRVSDRALLAIGDPSFSADQGADEGGRNFSQLRASSDELNNLPRLVWSGDEVREIARNFDEATVLTDTMASKSNLIRYGKGRQFDVLHFATHAISHPGIPEQSLLVLSRGETERSSQYLGTLDTQEVTYGWDLDVDLITLSGCNTAQRQTCMPPMGFIQAWFGAGARSILASNWRVDDEATFRMMKRFYENLTGHYLEDRGQGPGVALEKAMALREAQLYLKNYIDSSGQKPFAHPFYWSGYALIGNPH